MIQFVACHFFTRWFLIFIVVVLCLELLKPALSQGGILSRGSAYDASIGLILIAFQFLIVNIALRFLFNLYATLHLPTLGQWVSQWRNWVLAMIGLVAADFLSWASHFIRHKTPWLWRFHAMHHSQQELNIFTEFRSHPLDALASSVMQSLPLYLLRVPFTISVPCLVIYKYYLMFTHANLDIDLGWLGRVLVSPKFHRVHHASEPELHDHNFGAVLAIWDLLFRTAKLGVKNVVHTGVKGFPTEHDAPVKGAGFLYFRQLAAPFKSAANDDLAAEPPPV